MLRVFKIVVLAVSLLAVWDVAQIPPRDDVHISTVAPTIDYGGSGHACCPNSVRTLLWGPMQETSRADAKTNRPWAMLKTDPEDVSTGGYFDEKDDQL